MQSLSLFLTIVCMTAWFTNTAYAQMHRKKIIIGRRNGPEQPSLWPEEGHSGRAFSLYDQDGDGFLSQREFYSLPLCRDPLPCDLSTLAEELKDELKTEHGDWRR